MKKLLTAIAFVAILAGCTAAKYDDTVLLDKIAFLEKRVQTLEGNMSALQTALKGKFVQKVEEYKNDDGVTVGVTVTYTDGDVKRFEISTADPADGPVLCVMTNGAGELCWAIDWGGEIGKVLLTDAEGNDVTVYLTPAFEIKEDGHLWMILNDEETDLGEVVGPQGAEGQGTVQDGIVKDIQVSDEAVTITYDQEGDEDGVVVIPLVNSFKLVIGQTQYHVEGTSPIDVPYTIQNKTANTVVDAYYSARDFAVEVQETKLVVTPKAADSEGMILVYADSKTGLTSIVKLTFTAGEEAEVMEIGDEPSEEAAAALVDYLAEAAAGAIDVHVVTNIEFEVAPQEAGEEWIHVGEPTKATRYTLPVTLDENTSETPRIGYVVLYRKGTTEEIQSIAIGQKGKEASGGEDPQPGGAVDLSKDGTANCYIIYEAGEYKFKAVKGNSNDAVAATEAVVLWETFNNADQPNEGDVIASAEYADGYITFSTPETFKAGNAVIAAKDGDGKILWSWHIWAPSSEVADFTGSAFNDGSAQTIAMDRNLGALEVATAEGATVYSFGMLYQWGRKDPFPGAKRVDSGSHALMSGTEISVAENLISYDYSVEHPTVMGYAAEQKDWIDTSDMTLWGSSKTVNDPCPVGYKVPGRNKSWPIMAADLEQVEGWSYSAENHIFTVGTPALVVPLTGFRKYYKSAVEYSQTGTGTILWSSYSSTGGQAYCTQYDADETRAGKIARLTEWQAGTAASVRCVKE